MALALAAKPTGEAKRALVPLPSRDPPWSGAPAKVVTTHSDWEGEILRMVLLPVSATYKLPELSRVRPNGPLKRAAMPVPSLVPAPQEAQPATVVTIQFVPSGAICRTVLLKCSTT